MHQLGILKSSILLNKAQQNAARWAISMLGYNYLSNSLGGYFILFEVHTFDSVKLRAVDEHDQISILLYGT